MAQRGADSISYESHRTDCSQPEAQKNPVHFCVSADGKLVAVHMNSPVDFNRLPLSNKDSVSRSYACHEAFVLCRRKHQGL